MQCCRQKEQQQQQQHLGLVGLHQVDPGRPLLELAESEHCTAMQLLLLLLLVPSTTAAHT
jgi:hypothetical protein